MQKNYCFLSNYLTHHQLPFCLEMMRLTGGRFVFVETEELPLERKNMGYVALGEQYDFVIHAQKSEAERKKAMDIAFASDVVIIGSAPDDYIRRRLKTNKLTFRYSERIFKKGLYDVLRWVKYTLKTLPYRNKNLYYLLSSAYAAHDYRRCGARTEKLFKWGYFPECKVYENIDALFTNKKPGSILWVGRMLDWKHPDVAVETAHRLKKAGVDFELNMIGSGPMEQTLKNMVKEYELEDCVHMLGSVNPDTVRQKMEEHQIFLFTSDYNEGWGAVLNEAMNSGCAVVASHACGSVPFMIKHKQNGLVYQSGDVDALYEQVRYLLDTPTERHCISVQAIETATNHWNARVAAERLQEFCVGILRNEPVEYEEGILSSAPAIMQEDMFAQIAK